MTYSIVYESGRRTDYYYKRGYISYRKMGKPPTCARVGIVVINIFFAILGLLLFLGGSFLRSRYSALNQLVSGALDSLEKFLQSAGYGTVDLSSNFGFSDLFHAVAIGLIFLGLFLVILSTIGSCAGCFMSAALLIIYVVVCVILILGQIAAVVIFYKYPQVYDDAVMQSLKNGIQSNYQGINGTTPFSIGWNVVMQQMDCCGVENYSDFTGASRWTVNFPAYTLQTPLACCKTLPSSSDYTCAAFGSATTGNNNMYTGCYETVKDKVFGNVYIMGGVLGGLGVIQVLLIMFAIIICMARRDNKVSPRGKSPNQRSAHKTRDKKYQFN